MLACRQKILATVKPYHKDAFAFNFVRVFLAGNNFAITQHEMFELCKLQIYKLIEIIMSDRISESLRQQIGWYIASSHKAVILGQHYNCSGLENSIYLATQNEKLSSRIAYLKSVRKENTDIPNRIIFSDAGLSKKNRVVLVTRIDPPDYYLGLLRYGFEVRSIHNHFFLFIRDYVNAIQKNELESAYKNALMGLAQGEDYETMYQKYILPSELLKLSQEIETQEKSQGKSQGKQQKPELRKRTKIQKIDLNIFFRVVFQKTVADFDSYEKKLKMYLMDILPVKMFYDFIEHGSQTFNVYQISHEIYSGKLYDADEFLKLEYRKIPFDTTKSFYEVVRNIAAELGQIDFNYFPCRSRFEAKIKSFVEKAYNPLSFIESYKK